jgi:AcrR family transcriptional regulator
MNKKHAASVRDRIREAALDLFYKQGYHATGITQIIKHADVAKASFYDHFPSKDDLLYDYVCEVARVSLADLNAFIARQTDPRQRFFAPLEALIPWLEAHEYRGCPFYLVLAETPGQDKTRKAITRFQDDTRQLLRRLVEDLREAEPGLKRLDPAFLADHYLLLLEGATSLAAMYRDPWPVEQARLALAKLVSED